MRQLILPVLAACILSVPTIYLKILTYNRMAEPEDVREHRVISFLESSGFYVEKARQSDQQYFSLIARIPTCRMDLHEVSPKGYDRSAMTNMAKGHRLFYVDQGRVYPAQPSWTTWAYWYKRRLYAFVGYLIPKRLTFAVIADKKCADVDWKSI